MDMARHFPVLRILEYMPEWKRPPLHPWLVAEHRSDLEPVQFCGVAKVDAYGGRGGEASTQRQDSSVGWNTM